MQRDERSELLARLRRGHRLIFDTGRADPGWRSALSVGNQVRYGRNWPPAAPGALLAEGLIRRTGQQGDIPCVTRYELAGERSAER